MPIIHNATMKSKKRVPVPPSKDTKPKTGDRTPILTCLPLIILYVLPFESRIYALWVAAQGTGPHALNTARGGTGGSNFLAPTHRFPPFLFTLPAHSPPSLYGLPAPLTVSLAFATPYCHYTFITRLPAASCTHLFIRQLLMFVNLKPTPR